MKWHWRLLGLIWMIAASTCYAQPAGIPFSLRNPLDIQRDKEVVIITRAQYLARTHYTPTHLLPQAFDSANQPIPTQADDLNGDHLWDEIAMLVSLSPMQTARFRLQMVSPEKVAVFPQTTRAWLAPYVMTSDSTGEYREVKWARINFDSTKSIYAQYQMGGIVLENEKNAIIINPEGETFIMKTDRTLNTVIGPSLTYSGCEPAPMNEEFKAKLIDLSTGRYLQVCNGPVRSIACLIKASVKEGQKLISAINISYEMRSNDFDIWFPESSGNYYSNFFGMKSNSDSIHLIGF